MNLSDEIPLKEDRIKAITEAKIKIESLAKERFEQEQSQYQDHLDKREAKAKESGHKPRGKSPVLPVEGAQDKELKRLYQENCPHCARPIRTLLNPKLPHRSSRIDCIGRLGTIKPI